MYTINNVFTHLFRPKVKMKILVIMNISVLSFYGYIENISTDILT